MPLCKHMPYLWSELLQYGSVGEPIEEFAEPIVSTDQLASDEEVEAPVHLVLAAPKEVDVEWH